MKKLTLRQAIALYNKGTKIYLKCSKVTEQMLQYSPWLSWYDVQKQEDLEDNEFIKIVNAFKYYNCNKELGLRVNYYAYI